MKTHHYIFLTTVLFIILFYDQNMGLNLGIITVIYSILTFFRTPVKNRTPTFFFLFITSLFSAAAFAWYGDFPSFLAIVSSVLLLGYRSKNRRMKILLLVPVIVTNCSTFLCRFFSFDKWLPKRKIPGFWQKMFAFILIPLLLISVFFGVYSAGSDHFANLFTNIELDINFWQLIAITALGLFVAFNYWNYIVERIIYKTNGLLDNNFGEKDKVLKPTYSFFDLDTERMSGLISLLALNILLVFFIITYNYEQFYETVKSPSRLSQETHERVNVVIISIVMAIFVIMFYFKSSFNFDPKAGLMKILAKVWIFLNAVLVISALVKNAEYIENYGFTYKRFGVYAFLILSFIGLVMTYIKIQLRKRNVFLFNVMTWYIYGTILACSYINWGGIITSQNMKRKDFMINYYETTINFNEKQLLEYAERNHNQKLKQKVLNKVKPQQEEKMLSKILYYQTIK
ncbi:protein of unknown function [Chryseobacterium taichungense]|uniref:Uncharacterized protein n=1 Tax=Chryseobacterium taichungense TaxID=295069 RepID=A0A1H7Z492_9FLAO|nr:DUF4173 domain-containing protein [Chryseobacterium taichungense]SEM53085.1 protein of unknown function [Chryseobacterium taichungense]